MSYVFHRSSVLMMTSTGGVAPSSIADATCVPIGVFPLLGHPRSGEKGEMGNWGKWLELAISHLPFHCFPFPLLGRLRAASRRGRIVHLDFGVVLQSAENLIASGHDFVPGLESLGDLDVRHAHDASFDWNEHTLAAPDEEDTLNLFLGLLLLLGRPGLLRCRLCLARGTLFGSSS